MKFWDITAVSRHQRCTPDLVHYIHSIAILSSSLYRLIVRWSAETRTDYRHSSFEMAAIIIVAGLAIADKVEKKKEQKRQKKARDEARFRELQIETSRRLSRTQSGNVIEHKVEEEDREDEEEELHRENLHNAVDDTAPPPYEDAVQVGERRERAWAQMQRRRSSAYSSHSQRSNNRASAGFVRTG